MTVTTAPAAVTEIETTIGTTANGGPRVTRTWHCGDYTVRARIAHDTYRRQSYAVAEVLTPELTWTQLCEESAKDFHNYTNPPAASQLCILANQLMRRACAILRIPTS